MCLPQDPLSRAALKIDPLAKIDGRQRLSDKFGKTMDPLGTYVSGKDPVSQSLGVDPSKKYDSHSGVLL